MLVQKHPLLRTAAIIIIAVGVALLLIPSIALPQEEEEPTLQTASSADIVDVDILFVGAHPDDDSTATATMTRYVMDQGAKAGVVTATKGEGGGNAVGRELGPALGIVREAEERMALRQLGIDLVYYLEELDWAFTTSAEATEQFWGHEEPLGKIVRYYRVMQPDVIVTMNPSPRGHGHHQYIAKLATEAFFLAGDPNAFPEQLEEEFLDPWQPKKLYYALAYGAAGLQPSVQVPTNEISRSSYLTYAEMEADALKLYRSQGFHGYQPRLQPEAFTLAASVLPMPEEETSLLAGLFTGVDQAPPRVELEVTPENFYVSQGSEVDVEVVFRNQSDIDLTNVGLSLEAPEGWEVSGTSEAADVPVGESTSATFTVSVPADADVSDAHVLVGRFEGTDDDEDTRYASKRALVQVTPPVSVELQPIDAVANYREWARENNVQHLVRLVPAEIAIGAGETGPLPVILTNRSDEDVDVTVALSVDNADISLETDEQEVTVGADEAVTVDFMATVPDDMEQGEFEVTTEISYTSGDDYELSDSGVVQVVPSLTVPVVEGEPDIDADLSEYADLSTYEIPHDKLWEGETDNQADLFGEFQVTYDDEFLYVALAVMDEVVVNNIAPNDIKGHWRSDSVEITIDPLGPGASGKNTLTTFKTGIFPFDTEGNVQAERDADANQGPISETAPDMQFASAETDDGYNLEVAIPWNAVPGEVASGDTFGFNILLYDCDAADADIGENCNEARTAWSAWSQIQGTPRLWGHATLAEEGSQ